MNDSVITMIANALEIFAANSRSETVIRELVRVLEQYEYLEEHLCFRFAGQEFVDQCKFIVLHKLKDNLHPSDEEAEQFLRWMQLLLEMVSTMRPLPQDEAAQDYGEAIRHILKSI